MPKKKGLTLKQAKFVKGIAEGKTQTQAALEAYDTDNPETASAIAVENLRKPSIKQAVDMVLEKKGLTLDKIIEPVSKALVATKVEIHGNGEEAFAEVVDDLDMQLKGHDRAMKLVMIGQNNKEAPPIQANVVNIINEQKNEYGL